MVCEKFLGTEFLKYNNNGGFVINFDEKKKNN